MDLNSAWFLLVGVLLTGYAILDGFDLGVGALYVFARDDGEKRIHLNAIGPVWDGNEVWLLTGGGALFAAFPAVYATVFSSFYLPFMWLLTALILRAVSMEFRGKVDTPAWKTWWDMCFLFGSVLPCILYGVAVGNILRGIPLDADHTFGGTFLGLLNPYALLLGALSLVMFVMHGAAYMAIKTEGDLRARMRRRAVRSWAVFILLFATATVATAYVSPYLFDGAFRNPLVWLFMVGLAGSIVLVPLSARGSYDTRMFLATSLTIACAIGLAGAGMFPRMVPSSTDLSNSLTIYNASSTQRTLTVMLWIAAIGMPIVIVYTAYVYRVFKGKVVLSKESY